jgi:uncharacterized protein YabE (DUF348 family)
VPIAVFLFLLILTVGGLLWMMGTGKTLSTAQTDIVIISYDHLTRMVPSHEPTVDALLKKLQIPVNPGDVVEPDPATRITQDDFRINIYRASPVKIIEGDTTLISNSAATTPRTIAQQAGLTVYPEDGFSTEPVDNFLQQGAIASVVTVDPSVPVTLTINGYATATRTRAKTVGDFLHEKDIKLEKSASVTPATSTPITANQTIAVTRDGTGLVNVPKAVPMPTQYIDDATLAYGTFATRQTGSAGSELLVYQVTVQGGKVVNSTLQQTIVTVQPVTQIIARGTSLSGIKGDMAMAGISVDDYQYADYIISRESGWCPTKWQGEYGGCPAYHGAPSLSYVGYGLCQATPGYKMASAGSDWATNPITQLSWCNGYAINRYGNWYNAYLHWVNYHNW